MHRYNSQDIMMAQYSAYVLTHMHTSASCMCVAVGGEPGPCWLGNNVVISFTNLGSPNFSPLGPKWKASPARPSWAIRQHGDMPSDWKFVTFSLYISMQYIATSTHQTLHFNAIYAVNAKTNHARNQQPCKEMGHVLVGKLQAYIPQQSWKQMLHKY